MIVVLYILGIYIISVLLSYLIFRLTLIIDKKNAHSHPLGLATLIIILPIVNVIASLVILFINIPSGKTVTISMPNVNFKKLFGLRDE